MLYFDDMATVLTISLLNKYIFLAQARSIWTWRLVTVWWSVPVSLLERCTCVESKLDTSRMFLLMR